MTSMTLYVNLWKLKVYDLLLHVLKWENETSRLKVQRLDRAPPLSLLAFYSIKKPRQSRGSFYPLKKILFYSIILFNTARQSNDNIIITFSVAEING